MSLANAARRSFTSSSVRRGKLGLEGLASKVDLGSSRVLIRLDLNVPLSKDDGVTITDDTRLRAVVPTMNFLKEQGAQLLDTDVVKVDDCVGDDVAQACGAMPAGGVVLLENVRFHTGETKNFDDFASALAGSCGATAYVNDAFGTAHRAHASTEGVVYIKGAIDDPKRPLTAILGGAKVSTKIPVIESMLDKCDNVLVGGGMIFTFYKAMGHSVGASLIEEDMVPMAKDLIAKAQAKGVNFLLPTDVVVADKFAADANYKVVPVDGIPDGWLGLDVGPATQATFSATAAASTTVVWNGPMGVFEFDAFSKGTFGVADALAANESAITIIGGGDSVAAVEKAGLADKMSHISTGGGASLELLEGKVLPGVAALDDA
ncbi:phosphoglycerate kinase [Aureococcus anophagefferens]|nr:phosphoglycerate kinase [Aureococcus anophagefferens]